MKTDGRMATVTGINPAARFGELKIDGDRVETFSEKPQSGATKGVQTPGILGLHGHSARHGISQQSME